MALSFAKSVTYTPNIHMYWFVYRMHTCGGSLTLAQLCTAIGHM